MKNIKTLIYEINTAAYLARLGTELGRQATFDDVPESELLRLKDLGVTTIWFMGVWERSPSARAITASDQGLMAEFERVLPDFTREDLIGSAYAIKSYTVDAMFGGDEALKKLHARLKELQIDLLLDFVPNHTSPDSDLIHDHREYHITGTATDLETSPENYIELNGTVYARGRDPLLPAWPDVVQLNAFFAKLSRGINQHPATHCRFLRRRALRHGHADDQRYLCRNMGRGSRPGP